MACPPSVVFTAPLVVFTSAHLSCCEPASSSLYVSNVCEHEIHVHEHMNMSMNMNAPVREPFLENFLEIAEHLSSTFGKTIKRVVEPRLAVGDAVFELQQKIHVR